MILHLARESKGNYTITPITGNLYIEELGPVHQYHEEWTLIIGMNVTHTTERMQAIEATLSLAQQTCNDKCSSKYEIRVVLNRRHRLKNKEEILKKLTGKQRVKRGLANFVGDIAKTLFGTLSNSDLEEINRQFDQVYTENGQLANVISNNTKILKLLLDSSSHDYQSLNKQAETERHIAKQLQDGVNENTRNIFVNNKLLVATLMIDELSEDIDTAINAINNGRHGIVHPQILTPNILKETIKEFEEKQRTRYHFDNSEDNYQHILDISQTNIAIVRGLLTYIVKIPILEKEEGKLKHLIPIPERRGETYIGYVPDHEYLILYKDAYVPMDRELLHKCKSVAEYRICLRKQPNYRLSSTNTCDASLLKKYSKNLCKPSPFVLHDETYIPTENGFILIPANPIQIDFGCEDSLTTKEITRVSLITGSKCKIYIGDNELFVLTKTQMNKIVMTNITYDTLTSFDEINLLKNRLTPLPQQLNVDELNKARLSLDETENMMRQITADRRTRNWTEKAWKGLNWIGYTSITLLILGILYKCGVFQLLKYIPSKICLICVENRVQNQPQIVTYNNQPLLLDTESETIIGTPRHKRVRFNSEI
jgi:hypothetical protein